jgi:hypothetical protein
MSVDRKQFNRSEWTFEDVERHIRHAKRLRSEAIAQYARRLTATVGAGVRRLREAISNGLRGEVEKGVGALHAWAPARVATTPRRAAHCK